MDLSRGPSATVFHSLNVLFQSDTHLFRRKLRYHSISHDPPTARLDTAGDFCEITRKSGEGGKRSGRLSILSLSNLRIPRTLVAIHACVCVLTLSVLELAREGERVCCVADLSPVRF